MLSEYWQNRIVRDVNPRIEKFNEAQKKYYDSIQKDTLIKADAKCEGLTEDELQFVWDTACWKENFENNKKIALINEQTPGQIRALGELI